MNLERVQQGLLELFHGAAHRWSHEGRRIVFWYDPDGQFSEVFADLELPGVTKLELAGAPFNAKYRMLRLEPLVPFLLYVPHAEPSALANGLFDVQVYSQVFSADRAAMLFKDLGFVNRRLEAFLRDHLVFFAAKKRSDAFAAMQVPAEANERDLLEAMLSVLVGLKVPNGVEAVRRVLIGGLIEEDNAVWLEVLKFIEPERFWDVVRDVTGYREVEAKPSLRRLLVRLLVTHLERSLHGPFPVGLERQLIVPGTLAFAFVESWFNHVTEAAHLKAFSTDLEPDLNLASQLEGLAAGVLAQARTFEALDQSVIRACVTDLMARQVEFEVWRDRLRARRVSPWFERYEPTYRALGAALDLTQLLGSFAGLPAAQAREQFEVYVSFTHRIDRAYRQFITASDASFGDVLKPLVERVESQYTRGFLEDLGAAWSDALERLDIGSDGRSDGRWGLPGVTAQTMFFERFVRPILERHDRSRVCVVISDALRFEVAAELRERLMFELRGEVGLEPILSVLPSVTKFGMAALLPAPLGSGLEFVNDRVLRGGLPTNTSEARAVVLEAYSGVNASVFAADRVLAWNSGEGREQMQPFRLAYIYHNEIDSIGDKASSESDVLIACSRAIDELVRVVKKLVNSLNITNVILTSDHGFLYQRQPLEEADKLEQPRGETPQGERVLDVSQRHALGLALEVRPGTLRFAPDWTGGSAVDSTGDSDLRLLVPRGSLRFKASGGKQYVHGGASLQEVCVPVLSYRDIEGPKAQDGVSRKVRVQLSSGTRRVTNSRFSLNLVQEEAVEGRIRPRSVTLVMLNGDGKAITDERRAELASPSPHPSERNVSVRLSVIGNPPAGSNAWLVVRDAEDDSELLREAWTINLSISNDFGDF